MTTARKRKPAAPLTPAQIEAARVAAEQAKARTDAAEQWSAEVRAERAVGTWPWAAHSRVNIRWYNGQDARIYHDVGRVPEFQRGAVWAEDRAVAYVTAWCRGLASSSMLVWATGHGKERQGWILDGQQRMMALGFTLRDASGEIRRGPVGYLDFETGAVVSEPGPMRMTIAEITARASVRELGGPDNRWWQAHTEWIRDGDRRLAAMVFDAEEMSYTMPHTVSVLHQDTTPEAAREYFRHWNIPGVPFAEGEIDRLLSIVGGAS